MILTRHSWLPRNGDRYVRVNHIIDIINSIVCDSLLSRGKKHDIDSSEERKVNLYSSDRPPDRRWFTGQADRIQRMTTRGHQTRVEAFKLIKIVRFFLWGWGLSGTDETTHLLALSLWRHQKREAATSAGWKSQSNASAVFYVMLVGRHTRKQPRIWISEELRDETTHARLSNLRSIREVIETFLKH